MLILLSALLSFTVSSGQYTTCAVVVEDSASDNYRVDVEKELLFTYTSEQLRPFLKAKDYLSCDAYLTYISGGYYFLNLSFAIASPNAELEFGGIQQGASLDIELINDKTVRLIAREPSKGEYNTDSQLYVYKVQYPLSSNDVKRLKTAEIDELRIVWKQGYENYEIYYLDFFRNQFDCLSQNQR